MNEIWERVLANSFSGIHKSKIICSARINLRKNWQKRLRSIYIQPMFINLANAEMGFMRLLDGGPFK
jgi:hypothetical protein